MNNTIDAIVANTASGNRTDESAPVALLMECEDLAAAYRLCLRRSSPVKEAKQVAKEIGIDYEVLTKVLRRWQEGGDRRYMPNDKLIPFMLACGNSISLQWLMLQWRALTGVVTVPGGDQVKQVDALRLHGRLDSIEKKLDDLIAASRAEENCSMALDASSNWLFDAIFEASLEVGR